ncbi:MAG: 5-formyltetrahydrofolate cyclo-ligase [bacterium]|nr:5-formyltetrahydrofolate cyclo-ligase [bacterium]
MQKSLIRKRLIKERLALKPGEVASKSSMIADRILSLALFKNADNIALYSDFRAEVQTGLMIDAAFSLGKRILMPKVRREDYSIVFIPILSPDDLEKGDDGFYEPSAEVEKAFDILKIDLFIVPGVAYDLSGTRLGLGKGCYDRALKDVDRDIVLAPAYEFQLLKDLPCYQHDLKVGWMVTEDRVIKTVLKEN